LFAVLTTVGTKQSALVLNEKQYTFVDNAKDGSRTMVKGPGIVFVEPFQRTTGARDAIALKPDEYIKIINEKSGVIRVERGEKLVFLEPFEVLLDDGVQKVRSI
jgi:hypothetical protein